LTLVPKHDYTLVIMEYGPRKALTGLAAAAAMVGGGFAFGAGNHGYDVVQACHTQIKDETLSNECAGGNKFESEALIIIATLLESGGLAAAVRVVKQQPQSQRPGSHSQFL
jgi:hypothetical protein